MVMTNWAKSIVRCELARVWGWPKRTRSDWSKWVQDMLQQWARLWNSTKCILRGSLGFPLFEGHE